MAAGVKRRILRPAHRWRPRVITAPPPSQPLPPPNYLGIKTATGSLVLIVG